MLNSASGAVLALLAGSAAAQHHQLHRHQHARRAEAGSYPASSYAAPAPSYTASNYTASAPAGSSYQASKPTRTTTHYLTSTSTDVIYQTMTVEPLPESSPAAGSSYEASSYEASGPPLASTPAAGQGQCAPVYVTVTVTTTHQETSPAAVYTHSSPAVYSHASAAVYTHSSAAAANQGVYLESSSSKHEHHEHKHKSTTLAESSYELYSTAPAESSSYEVKTSPAAESTAHPAPTYKASSAAPAASSYSAKPSPSAAPASGSKRGVAYTSASALSGFTAASSDFWYWNWNCESGGLDSGLEYVPILNNLAQAGTFASSAQSAISAGSKYVMGCNEPDMTTGGGGSALTPQQAAQAYQTYIMPFAKSGVQLGSISVTSNNATSGNQNGVSPSSGLAYLAEWQQACTGCQVDFVQLHYYGASGQSGSEQASLFIEYVESACAEVEALFGSGTQVWFTEFSALPTLDQDTSGVNIEFMNIVLPYLESHPSVGRFAYFSASPNLLVNSDGSLTAAGKAYAQ